MANNVSQIVERQVISVDSANAQVSQMLIRFVIPNTTATISTARSFAVIIG